MAVPIHLQALHLAAVEASCVLLVEGLLTRHDKGAVYTIHELYGALVHVRFEAGRYQCPSCQIKGNPLCAHVAAATLHNHALTGAKT